jgi:glycosyltransferase involved in cell wall biosynthesis
MPTLSIIIPTLNCVHLIKRNILVLNSIGSLAREIIVVDSGSADGTVELIKKIYVTIMLFFLLNQRGSIKAGILQ